MQQLNYHALMCQWQGLSEMQQDNASFQSPVVLTFDIAVGWAAVTDGVGGQPGGEYASSEAINAIHNHFPHELCYLNVENANRQDELGKLAHKLAMVANDRVHLNGRRMQESKLPATTLALAVFDSAGNVAFAQVGDSLAYVGFNEERESHLVMKPHNAANDSAYRVLYPDTPPSSAITRYLGNDEFGPEIKTVKLGDRDWFTLSSDGAYEPWQAAGRPFEVADFFASKTDTDFTDNATIILVSAHEIKRFEPVQRKTGSRWIHELVK